MTQEDCNDCDCPGNGKCSKCHGTGSASFLDSLLVDPDDQMCYECNGSGKCQTCDGQGDIDD